MFATLCRFCNDTHIVLQDRRLALSGTIPGEDFPYSDHEGVEATFLLEERDTAISVPQRIYDGESVQLAATVGVQSISNDHPHFSV